MQQAFKSMMGQMDPQKGPFGQAPFPAGSPFPFPPPPVSPPAGTYRPTASQSSVTVDVAATKVEVAPPADVKDVPKDAPKEEEKTNKFGNLISKVI